jgi:hypothetical protein
LVEKESRFLALPEVGVEMDSHFLYRHAARDFSTERAFDLLQSFQRSNLGVISFQDGGWRYHFGREACESLFELVRPLGERLHDQVITVSIDDEGADSVGFTVDPTVSVRRRYRSLPELQRALQLSPPEAIINVFLLGGDQSERDLRPVAIESPAEVLFSGPHNVDDIPGSDVRRRYIGPVDPEVSLTDTILGVSTNSNLRHDSSSWASELRLRVRLTPYAVGKVEVKYYPCVEAKVALGITT